MISDLERVEQLTRAFALFQRAGLYLSPSPRVSPKRPHPGLYMLVAVGDLNKN